MKSNIITNLTFKQYEKKYKNYKKHLYSFTKQEVLDFDRQANTIGEHYVLNKRRWALIGDTYYEIPKPIRPMWFKGLSIAGKLATCIIPVGVVGALGGAGYGIYYAISQNNKPKSDGVSVEITGDAKDYIEPLTFTKNSDGDLVTTIKFKDSHTKSEIDTKKSTIELDGVVLTLKKDYIIDSKTLDLTIYKSAIKSDNPKIKITIVKKEEKGIEVTSEEWNAAVNYLITNNSSRNVTVDIVNNLLAKQNGTVYIDGLDEKIYSKTTSYEGFIKNIGKLFYESSVETGNNWVANETIKSFEFDRAINLNKIRFLLDKHSKFTFDGEKYVFSNDSGSQIVKFDSDKHISYSHCVTKASGKSKATDFELTFSNYKTTEFSMPSFPANALGFTRTNISSKIYENGPVSLIIMGKEDDPLPNDIKINISGKSCDVVFDKENKCITYNSLTRGVTKVTATADGYISSTLEINVESDTKTNFIETLESYIENFNTQTSLRYSKEDLILKELMTNPIEDEEISSLKYKDSDPRSVKFKSNSTIAYGLNPIEIGINQFDIKDLEKILKSETDENASYVVTNDFIEYKYTTSETPSDPGIYRLRVNSNGYVMELTQITEDSNDFISYTLNASKVPHTVTEKEKFLEEYKTVSDNFQIAAGKYVDKSDLTVTGITDFTMDYPSSTFRTFVLKDNNTNEVTMGGGNFTYSDDDNSGIKSMLSNLENDGYTISYDYDLSDDSIGFTATKDEITKSYAFNSRGYMTYHKDTTQTISEVSVTYNNTPIVIVDDVSYETNRFVYQSPKEIQVEDRFSLKFKGSSEISKTFSSLGIKNGSNYLTMRIKDVAYSDEDVDITSITYDDGSPVEADRYSYGYEKRSINFTNLTGVDIIINFTVKTTFSNFELELHASE